jgi:hypothetical protein
MKNQFARAFLASDTTATWKNDQILDALKNGTDCIEQLRDCLQQCGC